MNIEENKKRFIELLRSTDREGVDSLIDYLENKTDFFTAPASTKYHGNVEGGLCAHSLLVYDYLNKINQSVVTDAYPEDTIKIVSLLHDLAKVNLYQKTTFNKKVYSSNGSKSDAGGRFDWVTEEGWRTIDSKDKFIFGNHEATSEFIVRQFIPLHIEESVAILHHHGGLGWDSIPKEAIGDIYSRYHIAMYLHTADMYAAFVEEM